MQRDSISKVLLKSNVFNSRIRGADGKNDSDDEANHFVLHLRLHRSSAKADSSWPQCSIRVDIQS